MRISEIMPTPKQTDLSTEQTVLVDHSWRVSDHSDTIDIGTKFAEAFCIGMNDAPNEVALRRDSSLGAEEYRLGIAPGRCAVVEDAPPGVKAAKAAGMAAVGMASTGRTTQELVGADIVVSSLSELSPAGLRELIENRRREK